MGIFDDVKNRLSSAINKANEKANTNSTTASLPQKSSSNSANLNKVSNSINNAINAPKTSTGVPQTGAKGSGINPTKIQASAFGAMKTANNRLQKAKGTFDPEELTTGTIRANSVSMGDAMSKFATDTMSGMKDATSGLINLNNLNSKHIDKTVINSVRAANAKANEVAKKNGSIASRGYDNTQYVSGLTTDDFNKSVPQQQTETPQNAKSDGTLLGIGGKLIKDSAVGKAITNNVKQGIDAFNNTPTGKLFDSTVGQAWRQSAVPSINYKGKTVDVNADGTIPSGLNVGDKVNYGNGLGTYEVGLINADGTYGLKDKDGNVSLKLSDMLANSTKWWNTDDKAERKKLEKDNALIGSKHGNFRDETGTWYTDLTREKKLYNDNDQNIDYSSGGEYVSEKPNLAQRAIKTYTAYNDSRKASAKAKYEQKQEVLNEGNRLWEEEKNKPTITFNLDDSNFIPGLEGSELFDNPKSNVGYENRGVVKQVADMQKYEAEHPNLAAIESGGMGSIQSYTKLQRIAMNLSDEEKRQYNYLYDTKGEEFANTWLEMKYKENIVDPIAETVEADAKVEAEHPYLSIATTALENETFGLVSSVQNIVQTAINESGISYSPVGETAFNKLSQNADKVRSNVLQNINDNDEFSDVKKHALSTGYQVATSLADMGVSILVGGKNPKAIAGIMSSYAANSSMLEALDNGATEEQAAAIGLATGFTEYIFEKVSVGRFLDGRTPIKNVKTFVTKSLEQGAIEGSEEVLTNISQNIADTVIMGDKSNYAQLKAQYQTEGMDESEASLNALKALYWTASVNALEVGFISGTLMGTAGNSLSQLNVGNSIKSNSAYAQDLANTAKEIDLEEKYIETANKILDAKERVSSIEAANLKGAIEEYYQNEAKENAEEIYNYVGLSDAPSRLKRVLGKATDRDQTGYQNKAFTDAWLKKSNEILKTVDSYLAEGKKSDKRKIDEYFYYSNILNFANVLSKEGSNANVVRAITNKILNNINASAAGSNIVTDDGTLYLPPPNPADYMTMDAFTGNEDEATFEEPNPNGVVNYTINMNSDGEYVLYESGKKVAKFASKEDAQQYVRTLHPNYPEIEVTDLAEIEAKAKENANNIALAEEYSIRQNDSGNYEVVHNNEVVESYPNQIDALAYVQSITPSFNVDNVVQRTKTVDDYEVGQKKGNTVTYHKSAMEQNNSINAQKAEQLLADRDYDIIQEKPRSNSVTFIYTDNFDGNTEPRVTGRVEVTQDRNGSLVANILPVAPNEIIIDKSEYVPMTYTGFNVPVQRAREQKWKNSGRNYNSVKLNDAEYFNNTFGDILNENENVKTIPSGKPAALTPSDESFLSFIAENPIYLSENQRNNFGMWEWYNEDSFVFLTDLKGHTVDGKTVRCQTIDSMYSTIIRKFPKYITSMHDGKLPKNLNSIEKLEEIIAATENTLAKAEQLAKENSNVSETERVEQNENPGMVEESEESNRTNSEEEVKPNDIPKVALTDEPSGQTEINGYLIEKEGNMWSVYDPDGYGVDAFKTFNDAKTFVENQNNESTDNAEETDEGYYYVPNDDLTEWTVLNANDEAEMTFKTEEEAKKFVDGINNANATEGTEIISEPPKEESESTIPKAEENASESELEPNEYKEKSPIRSTNLLSTLALDFFNEVQRKNGGAEFNLELLNTMPKQTIGAYLQANELPVYVARDGRVDTSLAWQVAHIIEEQDFLKGNYDLIETPNYPATISNIVRELVNNKTIDPVGSEQDIRKMHLKLPKEVMDFAYDEFVSEFGEDNVSNEYSYYEDVKPSWKDFVVGKERGITLVKISSDEFGKIDNFYDDAPEKMITTIEYNDRYSSDYETNTKNLLTAAKQFIRGMNKMGIPVDITEADVDSYKEEIFFDNGAGDNKFTYEEPSEGKYYFTSVLYKDVQREEKPSSEVKSEPQSDTSTEEASEEPTDKYSDVWSRHVVDTYRGIVIAKANASDLSDGWFESFELPDNIVQIVESDDKYEATYETQTKNKFTAAKQFVRCMERVGVPTNTTIEDIDTFKEDVFFTDENNIGVDEFTCTEPMFGHKYYFHSVVNKDDSMKNWRNPKSIKQRKEESKTEIENKIKEINAKVDADILTQLIINNSELEESDFVGAVIPSERLGSYDAPYYTIERYKDKFLLRAGDTNGGEFANDREELISKIIYDWQNTYRKEIEDELKNIEESNNEKKKEQLSNLHGFEEGKTSREVGKILKDLEKVYNWDAINKTASRKELCERVANNKIYAVLHEDGMYKLYGNVNKPGITTYTKITKTMYDYIKHLQYDGVEFNEEDYNLLDIDRDTLNAQLEVNAKTENMNQYMLDNFDNYIREHNNSIAETTEQISKKASKAKADNNMYGREGSIEELNSEVKGDTEPTTLRGSLYNITPKKNYGYTDKAKANITKTHKAYGKNVSTLLNRIENLFHVSTFAYHYRNKGNAAGWFDTISKGITTQQHQQLGVNIHELAHFIDDKASLYSHQGIKDMLKYAPGLKDGLKKLGYTEEEMPYEVIADFLYKYITDPDTAYELGSYAKGENFYDTFENELDFKLLKSIQSLRGSVLAFMDTPMIEKMKEQSVKSKADIKREQKLHVSDLATPSVAKGKVLEGFENLYANFRMNIADSTWGAERVNKALEKATGEKLSPEENLRVLVELSGSCASVTDSIITDKLRNPGGEVIGESLTDLITETMNKGKKITKAKDNEIFEDLSLYAVARHGIDREMLGQITMTKDATSGDNIKAYENIIETLDNKYKYGDDKSLLREQTDKLYDWYDKFMRAWYVDTGLTSREEYDRMRKKYPHYVPFFREVDARYRNGSGNALKGASPVKRVSPKGSTRRILNPIENIMVQVNNIVTAYHQNAVGVAIHSLVNSDSKEKQNIMSSVAREVNAPLEKNKVDVTAKKDRLVKEIFEKEYKTWSKDRQDWFDKLTAEEQQTVIDEVGERELIDDSINDIITQFLPSGKPSDESMICAIVDGKKVYYEIIDPYFAKTILTAKPSSEVLMLIGKLTRAFSALTTSNNILFSVPNAIRDFAHSYVMTDAETFAQNFTFPFEWLASLAECLKNEFGTKKSDMYGLYKSTTGYDRKYKADSDTLGSVMRDISKAYRTKNPLFRIIKAIWDFSEKVNSAIENTGRYVAFKRKLKATGDLQAAGQAGRGTTVNFNRKGFYTRELSNVYPFLGAAVAGVDQSAKVVLSKEAWTTKNGRARIARGIAFYTLTTLFMMLSNMRDDETKKEYDEIDERTKNNYWVVKVGDTWIRLPKDRELGAIFGTPFQNMLLDIFYPDTRDEKTTAQFIDYFVGQFIPSVSPVGYAIVQAMNNKTWYGSSIVPYSQESLLNTPETYMDVTDESTSFIAEWIAKALNSAAPDFMLEKMGAFATPKGQDYVLDQLTGGIGDLVLPLTTPNEGIGGAGALFKQKFTVNQNKSSRYTSEAYDIRDRLQALSDAGKISESDEEWLKVFDATMSKSSSDKSNYKTVGDYFADIRGYREDLTLSYKERVEKTNEAYEHIAAMTYDLVRAYKNGETPQTNYGELTLPDEAKALGIDEETYKHGYTLAKSGGDKKLLSSYALYEDDTLTQEQKEYFMSEGGLGSVENVERKIKAIEGAGLDISKVADINEQISGLKYNSETSESLELMLNYEKYGLSYDTATALAGLYSDMDKVYKQGCAKGWSKAKIIKSMADNGVTPQMYERFSSSLPDNANKATVKQAAMDAAGGNSTAALAMFRAKKPTTNWN